MIKKYYLQIAIAIVAIIAIGGYFYPNVFGARTADPIWDDEEGDATLLSGKVGIGVTEPQEHLVLLNDGAIVQLLDVPAGSTATTTNGTLDADTYYFKITTLDHAGGQSAPSDEFSVTVGNEGGIVATSTAVNISWTDVLNETSYRVWISTSTGNYNLYSAATTTSSFWFATTTGLTVATIPSTATAYLNKIATSSNIWFMNGLVNIDTSGQVGIGTTTPAYDLDVYGNIRADGTLNISGNTTFGGAFDVGRLTSGGSIWTISTTTNAFTLREADLITYTQIDFTLTGGAATHAFTLPATSTMTTLIPNAGDCIPFRIRNLSTEAASTTTITEGTGTEIVEALNDDEVVAGAGASAVMNFCREADTDVTVYLEEFIAND